MLHSQAIHGFTEVRQKDQLYVLHAWGGRQIREISISTGKIPTVFLGSLIFVPDWILKSSPNPHHESHGPEIIIITAHNTLKGVGQRESGEDRYDES